MVSLRLRSFGECEVLLHYQYSQVFLICVENSLAIWNTASFFLSFVFVFFVFCFLFVCLFVFVFCFLLLFLFFCFFLMGWRRYRFITFTRALARIEPKPPRPGFEIRSPIPFSTIITVMLRTPWIIYVRVRHLPNITVSDLQYKVVYHRIPIAQPSQPLSRSFLYI